MRPKRKLFEFADVCLFCSKKSCNKDKILIQVSTFEFCHTLEKCVIEKGDEEMMCRIGDFKSLIANGASYHKGCHCKYIIGLKGKLGNKPHDQAFSKLLEILMPQILEGKVLRMPDVLKWYQDILKKYIQ